MDTAIHPKTVVLPGGNIEISAPELAAGQQVTVFVVVEQDDQSPKQHAADILARMPGHLAFKTADCSKAISAVCC